MFEQIAAGTSEAMTGIGQAEEIGIIKDDDTWKPISHFCLGSAILQTFDRADPRGNWDKKRWGSECSNPLVRGFSCFLSGDAGKRSVHASGSWRFLKTSLARGNIAAQQQSELPECGMSPTAECCYA